MMIVGVMASGRKSFDSDYRDLAETAGGAIADRGCHLLTWRRCWFDGDCRAGISFQKGRTCKGR